jgi:hypothetical protein
LRHECHKVEVTSKGDLTSVLSHKDSTTKTGVKSQGLNKKTQKYNKKNHKQQELNGLGVKLGGSRSWRRVRNTRRPRAASQQQGETESFGAAGG